MTLNDAPRLCDIYNQAIATRASTCDLELQRVEDIESWFEDRHFSIRPIYVYLADDFVAGYLSVSNFWNDRPGYRVTADCGVYIDSKFQNQRVGSALLQRFLDDAGGLGVHTIVTSMFADNQASFNLFKKFGFEQIGLCRHVANLEGVWKDLAIVQRDIKQ